MPILVTGTTGFIGANLVRELLKDGREVRVLIRKTSDTRAIDGLPVVRVYGDLRDAESLKKAIAGCHRLFHVAASYHLWMRDYNEMFASNVEGTRNILEAALAAGVERAVYTSTIGVLGHTSDGSPANENTQASEADMQNPYKLSKFRAEQEAKKFVARGLPLVIVNPSAPIGPWDVKPTPTGKMVVDFLNGKMPGYIDTGLNIVHVRDVARGHILAMEKGRIGERYILGGENLTLKQIGDLLADISGLPCPKHKVPYFVALVAAHCSELSARLFGGEPTIPLAGVRLAKHKMFFDSSKAVRELGLPQTPAREALRDAVLWFREHGYARK